MRAFRSVINFFALRPFFTLQSLRAFWWIYVFAVALGLFYGLYLRVTHPPAAIFYLWYRTLVWVGVAFAPLSACLAIMTARLLVEVTMNLLSIANRHSYFQLNPRSVRKTLQAFIELTPFVTRGWLESFWWLFLIVTAWQVISDILLHGLSILNSVLGAVTYVAGVRSLFELATHLLSRGAATMPSGDDSLPRHLAKFFSMRPFLSLGDIKVFWWLYILVELHRLYLRLGTFTFGGNLPPPLYPYMSPNVLVAPLMTLTTIATARLFLEVVMFGPAEAPTEVAAFTRKPGTLSDGLKDFLNLRPFFTPARLQVFWWLFVFTVAANICDYLYLSWGQHILRWVMFVMPFLKPLYCVAGVRLLIEVARRGDRSAVQ